jgi:hypothetical protein
MATDQEVEEFLEHFGVLGMKWGHRRGRRNEALGRAARREGGIPTKLRAFRKITPVDFVVGLKKGQPIVGGARRKFVRVERRNARIAAGKASVKDKLIYYGSTRLTDLIPMRESAARKPTTARTDLLMVAGAGALWIGKKYIKSAIQKKAAAAQA